MKTKYLLTDGKTEIETLPPFDFSEIHEINIDEFDNLTVKKGDFVKYRIDNIEFTSKVLEVNEEFLIMEKKLESISCG